MVLTEIIIGLLSNALYDKSKKTYNTIFDSSNKVYNDSLKELISKYPRLNPIALSCFLEDKVVQESITSYFEYHDENKIYSALKSRFIEILDQD